MSLTVEKEMKDSCKFLIVEKTMIPKWMYW